MFIHPKQINIGSKKLWFGRWISMSNFRADHPNEPYQSLLLQVGITTNYRDKSSTWRWFKVTFWSPIWRWLNHLKGRLTIPRRSQRITSLTLCGSKILICLRMPRREGKRCVAQRTPAPCAQKVKVLQQHPSKPTKGPWVFSFFYRGIMSVPIPATYGISSYMNGCFFMVNVGKYTSPMDPMGYSETTSDEPL